MPSRLDPPVLLQRFGKLRVIIPITRKNGKLASHFLCDCGNFKTVTWDSISAGTRSCGCLQHEKKFEYLITHGMSKSPEYSIWCLIKRRCTNPKDKCFATYSKRGICQEWLNSFEAFYKDMGPRPSPEHTIDRIDNDGPYSPNNCRWATKPEQARNKSSNVNLTYQGKTQCLTDWAKEMNMPKLTLYSRLKRSGWSVERALTTPVRKAKPG